MLRSSLCHYSDAYILVSGTITIDRPGADDVQKQLIQKLQNTAKKNIKEHYKLIAIDLSKQQVLDADPKEMQQINFTGNLEQDGDAQLFLLLLKKQEKPFYIFQKKP